MKSKYVAILLLIGCLSCSFQSTKAQISVHTRLQITGVTGSSILPNYANWIVLDSYANSSNRPLFMGSGGLVNSTNASTQKYRIKIPNSERAIPKLYFLTCQGTVLPQITLVFIKDGVEIEKVVLYNVIIDSVNWYNQNPGLGQAEITVVFNKIRRTLKTDNSGSSYTYGWDLTTGTAF